MTETELFEESFNIAWSVLQRGGEIAEPDETWRVLCESIADLMERGERRRLMLSNTAVDAYRRQLGRA